jgi:hypothetical protein
MVGFLASDINSPVSIARKTIVDGEPSQAEHGDDANDEQDDGDVPCQQSQHM